MQNYFHTLAQYDAWANGELFKALTSPNNPAATDDRVLHLLGHLVAAKQVWTARIRGEETVTRNLWPIHPVPTAQTLLAAADKEMLSVTADPAADFDRIIRYANQTRRVFETPLCDILIHLVNHSTYHRGQLATAMKNAGATPASTDYILYARQLAGQL
ncbi:MAG: DinB family protein [Phycisphaerae bacterium]